MKLRIALVNTGRIWAGAEAVTTVLLEGLRARGHRVVLFCRPGGPVAERLGSTGPTEPIIRGQGLHPPSVIACRRALRRNGCEVLLTIAKGDVRTAGLAARLAGIPVVVRHANDLPFRARLRHRLYDRWIPAHHVANSAATRRVLLRSAPWLAPDAVTTIHNGISAEWLDPIPPADLGLPPGSVAIGHVGRFVPRKGVLELAEAWPRVAAAVPNAQLIWAGDGALEGEIRERLREAPRVHFLGFRSDVRAVLAALDLLAMPSRSEAFGMSALEAMATGNPVVACGVGGLAEIVADGATGILVPPEDPRSLADALIRLAGDAALRERMAVAGRARAAEHFSQAAMVDGYEALLQRTIGDARGEPA